MRFISYTSTDTYYEFVGENGEKMLIPSTDVVLVDDESGAISVKNTASRSTIGYLIKGSTPPTPPAFQGKWLATYSDSSTTSAECDASSAITNGEITLTDLVSVEIGDCVTSIGRAAFDNCTSLTSVIISDSVTSIGNGVFHICTGLTSVTIGSGVTSIGDGVFERCSGLTSVDIPSSVTTIGNFGLAGCLSLTEITVNAVTPPTLGTYVFVDTNDCPIYVPSASVDTYKAASGWSTYADRIQPIA